MLIEDPDGDNSVVMVVTLGNTKRRAGIVRLYVRPAAGPAALVGSAGHVDRSPTAQELYLFAALAGRTITDYVAGRCGVQGVIDPLSLDLHPDDPS
jgi:hypothetical protein